MTERSGFSRAQVGLLYLVLTAAIASGIAIFSSASTITALLRTATDGLFLPILISLIATFLLDPLVQFFEREKIGRTNSIFIVYALLFLLALLLLLLIGPPNWKGMMQALKADLPRYFDRAVDFFNLQLGALQTHFPFIKSFDLAEKLRSTAEDFFGVIIAQTPKSAMRLGLLFA
jgi:putative permease